MNYINLRDENLLLWNKFREGDHSAFGELINIHYRDLFHYGERVARDTELVKDAIQDLFLSLWENRSGINETSFVKYYLLKSLRRRLIKTLSKKRFLHIGDQSFFENLFDPRLNNTLHEHLVQEDLLELATKVRKMLSQLPTRQQEIIYFRFYMNAEMEEIADIMDMNTQSVYNLLHRALKKLKKITSENAYSRFYFLQLLPAVLH